MNKNIQIPMSLFIDVFRLINALEGTETTKDIQDLIKDINAQLNAKIERMDRHEIYTQSKISDDAEQREQARQKYLDKAGVHTDWRY